MTEILVLNAGSSSLKLGLFSEGGAPLATGLADRIGPEASLRLKAAGGATLHEDQPGAAAMSDHAGALRVALDAIATHFPQARIGAVGHRVVHGGKDHHRPVVVDDGVLAALERLVPFAPLHQPHNLAGIRAARAAFPQAVQVACFDTAFHRGHPFVHDSYGLPRAYYDKGVRRYGFHGLSYDHIARRLAAAWPALHAGRVVVAHLGNGASLCGLRDGRSVASTMGFSALDGVPMGTRPGQLDPGVMLYLMQEEGLDADAIATLLYKQSGLLGLSGVSADMRALLASEDPRAAEAVDYFCARIRSEIGALAAALDGLDALVFTGGIGENAAAIRAQVCAPLGWLGVAVDAARNAAGETEIGASGARVPVLVVPTDEEGVIARAAIALASG